MSLSPVILPPDLESFVHDQIASGRFPSEQAVVQEALNLLKERESQRSARLEALREEIRIGMQQADCGDVAPLDITQIKARGRELLERQGI